MIGNVTFQLLAVLGAAALLGALIGACVVRLGAVRTQRIHSRQHIAQTQQLRVANESLLAEKSVMQQTLESDRKLLAHGHDKQDQLLAQQEAIQVHAQLQARRLATLEAELQAASETRMRLERDFASFKANKLREVRLLKAGSDEWLDTEELPVLNKRVAQLSLIATDPIANADAIDAQELSSPLRKSNNSRSRAPLRTSLRTPSSMIPHELDIPSLAESELPDSIEDLEFEMALVDEPEARG